MARASWKFIYFSKSIWRKLTSVKVKLKTEKDKTPVLTKLNPKFKKKGKYKIIEEVKLLRRILYDRSSSIPSCFNGLWVLIHKGRGTRRFIINRYNIGRKFGEFGYTRKPFHFPVRKKKGRKLRR